MKDKNEEQDLVHGQRRRGGHVDRHRCNSGCVAELWGLVDGCSDIIFSWQPQSPAQKVWKTEWLAKANKHGASLEC